MPQVLQPLNYKCNCCYTGIYQQPDGSFKFKTTLKDGEKCSVCGVEIKND